ncbi:hypothetical protein [Brevundimonas sp.]|uniref:hypothetical protein n=1 Tax=Brevundimonas sp. TaxID=1871086 RepID=UPI002D29E431|nr:hypothetical protein [Brevundimonas sp.]HYC68130.1 hypothetical protein [Brevundimonas sp.]
MSGIILAALAGLLAQQAAPPPSTQQLYEAPVIRPFEPDDDFGSELAEGDEAAAAHRPPLTPVTVDAYNGSYEVSPSDLEIAYQQGVASAEIRTDQTAGPLDGLWRVRDAAGRALYEIVLMDPGVGPAEGGWRALGGADGIGAATADGSSLRLEGDGVIALERSGTSWRGQLTRDGRTVAVTLTRPD